MRLLALGTVVCIPLLHLLYLLHLQHPVNQGEILPHLIFVNS